MPNLLTTQAGLKLGPIVLETFFKHYLERMSAQNEDDAGPSKNLRRDELLWQEAFEIVKSFLNQATRHTVEELQEFSNARIPSPPWTWVSQVLVPMSSCDLAATHLIQALGGEDVANRVVGGTKWWQVRGVRGVNSQWICQKSQMQDAQKRKRRRSDVGNENVFMRSPSNPLFPSIRKLSNNWTSPLSSDSLRNSSNEGRENERDREVNISDMDGTRCMLYAHGGGYYFGSVDQERYCLQRYARKINGRVFACNYRLSPQYPFPCAIQDLLAAYLYLIQPPSEAPHAPIPPESIVLGGDSAGGGLCLAALQVMRDSGIPLPAAAVLISPWCDLTHSFPSILQNTNTDIIPPYGLSLHKPSVLWPPPPKEISSKVRAGLRARFQKFVNEKTLKSSTEVEVQDLGGAQVDRSNMERDNEVLSARVVVGPAYPGGPDASRDGKLPLPWESSDSIHLHVDGKSVTINTQVQLYCPNSLLSHPLVSPALGYLGGLPPLLVIASDKEVLRDEIIYVAHKAAHPDRFPINESSKKVYPLLQDIQEKHGPTSVHLQVYDETAHVLPLFSFTTPAKYCYRAPKIALFAKHFTTSTEPAEPITPMSLQITTPESESSPSVAVSEGISSPLTPELDSPKIHYDLSGVRGASSVSRSRSSIFRKRKVLGFSHSNVSEGTPKVVADMSSDNSEDVAGSRFQKGEGQARGPGTAGDPSVYSRLHTSRELPLGGVMIRERVSTRGIVRPLEPESELSALQLLSSQIGIIKETAARRYLQGLTVWTKKFSKTAAKIEIQRLKNLELAKGETIHVVKTIAQAQEHLLHEPDELDSNKRPLEKRRLSTFYLRRHQKDTTHDNSSHPEHYTWGWIWALDGERPPPSSIVSRRDTVEARNLARVVDLSIDQEESKMSGNMLWSVLVDFLTAKPRHGDGHRDDEDEPDGEHVQDQSDDEDRTVRKASSGIFQRMKSLRGEKTKRQPSQGPEVGLVSMPPK